MKLTKNQKKRIAVWSIFFAAVIALGLALFLYIKSSFRENDLHTQTVNDTTLLPVSEAYAGKDDILGTTITLKGDKDENAALSFPKIISDYKPEKAYILTNITTNAYDFKKGAEEIQDKAPKLFKAFYGDRFDESCCSFLKLNELETFIQENYSGKNGETAYYGVSGYMLIDDQGVFADITRNCIIDETYFYKDSPDKAIKLTDGEITLKAAAQKVQDYYNTVLSEHRFGFEVRPYKAEIYDYNGSKALKIYGEKLYEGIPFESCISSYTRRDGEKETSYAFSCSESNMLSIDSIFSVKDQGNAIISKVEPVDEIISLKEAVKILKSNLAKNTDYTFMDIKLMYCCKYTQNVLNVTEEDNEKLKKLIEEDNATEYTYRPTWYFIINEENNVSSGIKVDAITGEITMDIP